MALSDQARRSPRLESLHVEFGLAGLVRRESETTGGIVGGPPVVFKALAV